MMTPTHPSDTAAFSVVRCGFGSSGLRLGIAGRWGEMFADRSVESSSSSRQRAVLRRPRRRAGGAVSSCSLVGLWVPDPMARALPMSSAIRNAPTEPVEGSGSPATPGRGV